MRIIITGGAGFIGSNLLLYLFQKYPKYIFMNIDKLTYASNTDYLTPLNKNVRYHFSQTDLINRDEVRNIIKEFKPDSIIHLAAESHVDNSIKGPEPFILSNVVGTFNLIEEARLFWQSVGEDISKYRFHHVSTDEVYGTLGSDGLFTENSPYAPNSPYSASKAGSDFIVRAYHHTYGMNVVTTNCSNNYGPHQHDEKLIPTVIRNAYFHNPIPVYGSGENIRDWLFVLDHCKALDNVFHNGKAGETFNIGGRNEWKNIDLVREICDILNLLVNNGPDGDYKKLIHFVSDRPGHDLRYAIDATKIEKELGWRNTQDFRHDLTETVKWYISKYEQKEIEN